MAELQPDDLAQKFAPKGQLPAPGERPRVVTAFLGESTQEGYWRLYFRPDLGAYAEVRAEDILHTEPLPRERFPLGGTAVWIKEGAPIQRSVVDRVGVAGARRRARTLMYRRRVA